MNIQDYLTCIGVPLDNTRVPTANEPGDGERCYRFRFGAYGWTVVDVFADSDESAFETAVEWLDDNAPGHLVEIGEAELREAAEELGLDYFEAFADARDNIDETEMNRIAEKAEEDLTVIGHTTLKNGQYLISHEWTFDELTP